MVHTELRAVGLAIRTEGWGTVTLDEGTRVNEVEVIVHPGATVPPGATKFLSHRGDDGSGALNMLQAQVYAPHPSVTRLRMECKESKT
jgi:hypothetical protein